MSDTKERFKIQIHVVSSVKGGCGKTAFSVFKALQLANVIRQRDLKNRKAGVLWLDADFNGTASKKLFYGENKKDFLLTPTIDKYEERLPRLFEPMPRNTENTLCFRKDFVPYTINDYLREDIRSIEKMTVHGYAVEEGEGQEGKGQEGEEKGCVNAIVDFIFSSGRAFDKKVFDYGNGLPAMEIGRFTYLMRAMLLKLCELGKTGTRASGEEPAAPEYEHLVIDMPPGDDAYASALLETIRQLAEEKEKDKEEKVKLEIHLYLLTTRDRGHVYAVQENMRSVCDSLRLRQHGETVYAVLSEVREGEFRRGSSSVSNSPFESCKNTIAACRDGILQEFRNEDIRIKMLYCAFQPEYYKFCREMDCKKFSYEIKEV